MLLFSRKMVDLDFRTHSPPRPSARILGAATECPPVEGRPEPAVHGVVEVVGHEGRTEGQVEAPPGRTGTGGQTVPQNEPETPTPTSVPRAPWTPHTHLRPPPLQTPRDWSGVRSLGATTATSDTYRCFRSYWDTRCRRGHSCPTGVRSRPGPGPTPEAVSGTSVTRTPRQSR